MKDRINQKRIVRRGLSLLEVYTKNRKVLPSLDVFINDYYNIVEPTRSNQFIIKKTSETLKKLYDDYASKHNTKTALTLIL